MTSSEQKARLAAILHARDLSDDELALIPKSNALLIANTVSAMCKALAQTGTIDIGSICSIQDTLMTRSGELPGLRNKQVCMLARDELLLRASLPFSAG